MTHNIKIVSGEGTFGTVEQYTGPQTAALVLRRLTRERCGGDRWAHVIIDGRTLKHRREIESTLRHIAA